MEIYVMKGNEQKGPFSEEEIRSQVMVGVIKLDDQVWWQGQADWKALGETPLLRGGDSGPEIDLFSRPRTSALAIASMVCGFIPFGFPIAIFLGLQAREAIRKDQRYAGQTLALGGICVGTLQCVLIISLMIWNVVAGFHKPLEDDPYATVDSSTSYGKITSDVPDL